LFEQVVVNIQRRSHDRPYAYGYIIMICIILMRIMISIKVRMDWKTLLAVAPARMPPQAG
jgi:hypothetical protein